MNALALFALTALTVSAAIADQQVTEDCWDTGCQLNSWAVKGCEQYGRYAKSQKPCTGGIIYTCCLKGTEKVAAEPAVSGGSKCSGEYRCVVKTSMPVSGCKAVSKKIVKKMSQRPCAKGMVYSCCTFSGAGEPTDSEVSGHSEQEEHQEE